MQKRVILSVVVLLISTSAALSKSSELGSDNGPDWLKLSAFPGVPPVIRFSQNCSMDKRLHGHIHWVRTPKLFARTDSIHTFIQQMGIQLIPNAHNKSWIGHIGDGKLIDGAFVPQPFQRYDSVPGGNKVCKVELHEDLKRFLGQTEYKSLFLPTFVLPTELGDFQSYWKKHMNTVWILKPLLTGGGGQGIQIINKWEQKELILRTMGNDSKFLIQKYVDKPFLLGQKKVEMRVRLVITCFHPLRAYITYDDNLRVFTEKYTAGKYSFGDKCAHIYGGECRYPESAIRNQVFLDTHLNFDERQKFTDKVERLISMALLSQEEIRREAMLKQQVNRYNNFVGREIQLIIDEQKVPSLIEIDRSYNFHVETQSRLERVLNLLGFHLPNNLPNHVTAYLEKQLNGTSPIFPDYLYSLNLPEEDMAKQMAFESRFFQSRQNITEMTQLEEDILHVLTFDDVRQLVVAEDERQRALENGFKRVIPPDGTSPQEYLSYLGVKPYYHLLFRAWEKK